MRFRAGLAVGGTIGYYLGAKAGRPRYEQMQRWVDKLSSSPTASQAAEKARAVRETAKAKVDDLRGAGIGGDAKHLDVEHDPLAASHYVAPQPSETTA